MPMPSPKSEIPDFRDWPRGRLLMLLEEYRHDLGSIRILFGKKHDEHELYSAWIKAIEDELQRREK
jgi:hypothetical protein